MSKTTKCFDIFNECVKAIYNGTLIKRVSRSDKEYHFQNWCQARIQDLGINFDEPGRNNYPDFKLVDYAEGYEIKGLEYPGRVSDYDANSNVPSGVCNGRRVFYIFGRYPKEKEGDEYPVIDLVLCHGDFLNAKHDYVHKNKHIDGFGTYGDIMIRDRKMYVVPTPFALTKGTTGLSTLIVPADFEVPEGFKCVGDLVRTEAEEMVVGYSFNLMNNEITSETIKNPNAGTQHFFKAYRTLQQSSTPVIMA